MSETAWYERKGRRMAGLSIDHAGYTVGRRLEVHFLE
jgi:hypothetical protein